MAQRIWNLWLGPGTKVQREVNVQLSRASSVSGNDQMPWNIRVLPSSQFQEKEPRGPWSTVRALAEPVVSQPASVSGAFIWVDLLKVPASLQT